MAFLRRQTKIILNRTFLEGHYEELLRVSKEQGNGTGHNARPDLFQCYSSYTTLTIGLSLSNVLVEQGLWNLNKGRILINWLNVLKKLGYDYSLELLDSYADEMSAWANVSGPWLSDYQRLIYRSQLLTCPKCYLESKKLFLDHD